MIIINLKAYNQQFNQDFMDDLELISDYVVDHDLSDKFMICPNNINLAYYKKKLPDLTLVSQSVDQLKAGSGTGQISAENLEEIGVDYVLLNHSENRLIKNGDSSDLINLIDELEDGVENLKVIACVETPDEASDLLDCANVVAIAYEPPELIGSGRSVTSFKPEEVEDFVSLFEDSEIIPLVGAGVSTAADVVAAINLGAKGVLLASAFIKAEDRLDYSRELIDSLN